MSNPGSDSERRWNQSYMSSSLQQSEKLDSAVRLVHSERSAVISLVYVFSQLILVCIKLEWGATVYSH